MITHVKKNSQKVKTAYIKPSRIESAVHFRTQEVFPVRTHSPRGPREASYSLKNRDVRVSKLNEYMRKMQTMYDSFPYPLFSL